MSDALDALDWLLNNNPDCSSVWIAGFGYGGDICIRAAMRRPNIDGFVSISPAFGYQIDFSSLTPCPNGLIVAGCLDETTDWRVCESTSKGFVNQKGSEVKFIPIEGADKTYKDSKHELEKSIKDYLAKVIDFKKIEKVAFV
jgi:alpha/beta superfamily hydrolase